MERFRIPKVRKFGVNYRGAEKSIKFRDMSNEADAKTKLNSQERPQTHTCSRQKGSGLDSCQLPSFPPPSFPSLFLSLSQKTLMPTCVTAGFCPEGLKCSPKELS